MPEKVSCGDCAIAEPPRNELAKEFDDLWCPKRKRHVSKIPKKYCRTFKPKPVECPFKPGVICANEKCSPTCPIHPDWKERENALMPDVANPLDQRKEDSEKPPRTGSQPTYGQSPSIWEEP